MLLNIVWIMNTEEIYFEINLNNSPTWDINDPITMDEIQNTVLDMQNNKAPGPDGIPIEFFKAFFSKSDFIR